LTSFTRFNKTINIPEEYELLVSELTKARTSMNISQESLAYKIGCTNSLIHKWETRKRLPSGFMLICWLDALGYQIEVKKRDSEM